MLAALQRTSRVVQEHLPATVGSSGSVGLCLVMGLTTGCATQEPPVPSDPELRAELGIPADVTIHRIDLSARGDETRVLPRETEIRRGEVVQFVVLDHRVHLVRFEEDRLTPSAVRFLRDTAQDSPPPLVEQGARLVLSFDGAPLGSYAFIVDGGGPPVVGEIRVTDSRR